MTTTIDQHRATAYLDDGTELEVLTAQLTLDDSWTPYVQGTLTIPAPNDLTGLDPRQGPRITIALAQVFGARALVADLSAEFGGLAVSALSAEFGGQTVSAITTDPQRAWNADGYRTPTTRAFRLRLRGRRVLADGTVELTIASDEALLIEKRYGGVSSFAAPTMRKLIAAEFAQLNSGPFDWALADGPVDAALPIGLNRETPTEYYQMKSQGQQAWDYLNGFAQGAGLRLWCDEAGLWQLGIHEASIPGTVTLTAPGTTTDASSEINRDSDQWYDHVLITWKWTDHNGNAMTQVDQWPIAESEQTRTLFIQNEFPPPFNDTTPLEDRPAARMWQRLQRAGHMVDVTAIADYTVTPGQAASINIPPTPALTGQVKAVTWSIPDGEMTVTTRNLEEII